MSENTLETNLEFHGRFVDSILYGTKRHSIRKGTRYFAPTVNVCGYRAVVNSQTYCRLAQVDFTLFQSEGWNTVEQTMDGLRALYPEIQLMDDITIVEFRLEIPPAKVKK